MSILLIPTISVFGSQQNITGTPIINQGAQCPVMGRITFMVHTVMSILLPTLTAVKAQVAVTMGVFQL